MPDLERTSQELFRSFTERLCRLETEFLHIKSFKANSYKDICELKADIKKIETYNNTQIALKKKDEDTIKLLLTAIFALIVSIITLLCDKLFF